MPSTLYVNVNGTWKTVSNYYINDNGTWRTGSQLQVKVNSSWEGAPAAGGSLPTATNILTLDYLDFTLPSIGGLDSKSGLNSLTLDIVDFTLPVIGRSR